MIGGYLHYMNMKKSLKNLLLCNCWSDFGIIHRNVPWITHFKRVSRNFDPSINMALVNGGCLHCTDKKKFFSETAKNGYGPLKTSGERSKAILALLLTYMTHKKN